jgi:hypothetical protein
MHRILITAIAASGLFATAANATTITTGMTTIQFGQALTDFTNAAQSLNLFDSNLGTLESVTITGTYGFNSTLTISSTSPSSGSAKTESAATFGSSNTSINSTIQALLDTGGAASIGTGTLNPVAFDVLGGGAAYSLPANSSLTASSNATTKTTGAQTDSNATDLLAFEAAGGGTFAVLFNTLTGTTLSTTAGNASATQVTQATGAVSIDYTYDSAPPTDVPEPASMTLLGAGIFSMGVMRRPRKVAP